LGVARSNILGERAADAVKTQHFVNRSIPHDIRGRELHPLGDTDEVLNDIIQPHKKGTKSVNDGRSQASQSDGNEETIRLRRLRRGSAKSGKRRP